MGVYSCILENCVRTNTGSRYSFELKIIKLLYPFHKYFRITQERILDLGSILAIHGYLYIPAPLKIPLLLWWFHPIQKKKTPPPPKIDSFWTNWWMKMTVCQEFCWMFGMTSKYQHKCTYINRIHQIYKINKWRGWGFRACIYLVMPVVACFITS